MNHAGMKYSLAPASSSSDTVETMARPTSLTPWSS
jgi:hypothetical protein